MNTMKVNLHTHTYRCKHATGEDEDYVNAAIESGIETLGFSDHTPYPFPGDYISGFRQTFEEADDYFASVLELRERYRDKINILIGYETEYYPAFFNRLTELYKKYPLDYIILGQHHVGNESTDFAVGSFVPSDNPKLLSAYVDQVCEGMRTGVFTYVAHPDAFNFTGEAELYRQEMSRICAEAKKMSLPLEINLCGVRLERHYPRDDFWELVGKYGNDVIIGCDAHSPEHLHCEEPYNFVIEKFVDKYRLNLIEMPKLVSPNGARSCKPDLSLQ